MAERQRVRLAVFFSIPIATGASGEYYIVKDKKNSAARPRDKGGL